MHMIGISHRDLKLGNIVLSEKGECKVTYFGLSRLSYRRGKGIIFTNKYSGTKPYIAPEILCLKFKTEAEIRKWYYDPLPADIWALGISVVVNTLLQTLKEFQKPDNVISEEKVTQPNSNAA
ncbi:protein kinase-like protein 1 [Leptotrombidium deliense]|uniref:Protein kinase-like protein 1 n=1 Tax=Leptotrombidium deliense TaxID=299467 RepID=A0A443RUP4_9ACAR|nr:protein kinase-like protein 1 [Leptotrombidium deliense]